MIGFTDEYLLVECSTSHESPLERAFNFLLDLQKLGFYDNMILFGVVKFPMDLASSFFLDVS